MPQTVRRCIYYCATVFIFTLSAKAPPPPPCSKYSDVETRVRDHEDVTPVIGIHFQLMNVTSQSLFYNICIIDITLYLNFSTFNFLFYMLVQHFPYTCETFTIYMPNRSN
jgi:hypothetical protein